jgi:hypothetical protein
MHSRETQYKHESRKKEQELEKMKERMHRLLSDKVNKKVTGIYLKYYSLILTLFYCTFH